VSPIFQRKGVGGLNSEPTPTMGTAFDLPRGRMRVRKKKPGKGVTSEYTNDASLKMPFPVILYFEL
jgi:hypothetical protein